jgi:radical SAM superfamily enzyme YgiQ (UPF0313 family)
MVISYKPDIIGFSSFEPTYELGLKLLRSINDKDIFTIVGGVYATLCPEKIIIEDAVDAVCIGEGEDALVELCRSIETGKINYSIPNLWFKVDSEIVKNCGRTLVNLDEIHFQDWSPWKVPPRASKAMAGKIRITALVELSRGCPYNCTYCVNEFLNDTFKGNYRERSAGRFVDEVRMLQRRYDIKFVYFVDETLLTTSKRRFEELIEKYSVLQIPFWCQSRIESLTYEKVKLLKEIGLQAINIGIECGNEKFRKKILHRRSSNSGLIQGVQEAKRAGVRVGANVIIGLPGESRNEIFETIELIREAQPTSTMVHLFQPYEKTPMREESIKMGLIKDDFICGDYRFEPLGTGQVSSRELIGIQRVFNLYVDHPKNRWDEISEAESDDSKFAKLAREYQLKHYGRSSF